MAEQPDQEQKEAKPEKTNRLKDLKGNVAVKRRDFLNGRVKRKEMVEEILAVGDKDIKTIIGELMQIVTYNANQSIQELDPERINTLNRQHGVVDGIRNLNNLMIGYIQRGAEAEAELAEAKKAKREKK